jgi:hypothetical protein
MGKKKQQHVQQSMGQMVSKAALAQMGPAIEKYVQAVVQRLGSQIAMQQVSTLETMFSRIVVLETILMEKFGFTKEDLATKVAEVEDEKESLKLVDGAVEEGDVVRLEVKTKSKDQTDFQGSTRLKIYNIGSGQTIDKELESAVIGMKAGETKQVEFGEDKQMVAELTVNRVSRGEKPVETENKTEESNAKD